MKKVCDFSFESLKFGNFVFLHEIIVLWQNQEYLLVQHFTIFVKRVWILISSSRVSDMNPSEMKKGIYPMEKIRNCRSIVTKRYQILIS